MVKACHRDGCPLVALLPRESERNILRSTLRKSHSILILQNESCGP